ncbi:hypothetical protein F8M41_019300 [Gigaspora margarita]|uniref:Uncharacterized protein n=1 Tax=Gigaspora margarita TaxID=4874 RepID=A0A8H4EKL3_GIGMA|nr:hypothetical protein F8M41_019300 [Gigaspora margarita]
MDFFLEKNATKISALKLDNFYSHRDPELFHAIACLIKSQEQLRQFHLVGEEVEEDHHVVPAEFYAIISALECHKQSLREVIIENCDYSAEFNMLMN